MAEKRRCGVSGGGMVVADVDLSELQAYHRKSLTASGLDKVIFRTKYLELCDKLGLGVLGVQSLAQEVNSI